MRSPWFFVKICKQLWIIVRNAFIKFPFFRLSSAHFFHFYLYIYFFIGHFFHYFFRILFGCKLIFSLVTLFLDIRRKTHVKYLDYLKSTTYTLIFQFVSCMDLVWTLFLSRIICFLCKKNSASSKNKRKLKRICYVAQKLWEHASGSL